MEGSDRPKLGPRLPVLVEEDCLARRRGPARQVEKVRRGAAAGADGHACGLDAVVRLLQLLPHQAAAHEPVPPAEQPAVRRRAAAHGVDPARVEGQGRTLPSSRRRKLEVRRSAEDDGRPRGTRKPTRAPFKWDRLAAVAPRALLPNEIGGAVQCRRLWAAARQESQSARHPDGTGVRLWLNTRAGRTLPTRSSRRPRCGKPRQARPICRRTSP
mmetsp:Transcript_7963/g.25159  ORF Transcript_7963/g.25159 Transcript_7963/m.25159 type:complete len:214 (-) Transcript_7963:286-927(-)